MKYIKIMLIVYITVISLYGCSNNQVSGKELYAECMSETRSNYIVVGALIGLIIPPHIIPAIVLGGIGWGYWSIVAEDNCRIEAGYFPGQEKLIIPKKMSVKDKYDDDIYKSVFDEKKR
jgi:hypothetical protein